jgi:hypothetical protein
MSGATGRRKFAVAAALLAALIGIGGVALAWMYATLPGRYDREFEAWQVVEGTLELDRVPWKAGGVTLYPGARLFLSRRAPRDDHVYAMISDGLGGWVRRADLHARADRVSTP